MFPVLGIVEDHASGQPLLEAAIVDQFHDVVLFVICGETELVNVEPERFLAKLETPVVEPAIAILMDDPRPITGFRKRQRVKPLRQGPLPARLLGRWRGYQCIIASAGNTVFRSHLQGLCAEDKNRSRQ